MQATPISSINIRIKTIIVILLSIRFFLKTQAALENKNRRRWPAVRLAASRKPRAIG